MKRIRIYDTFIYKVYTHIHISAICSAPCVCICASESISLSVADCSSTGSSVHGILQARTVEWEAIPFSRGSSQPQIQVSCIAGRFFIIWATREAHTYIYRMLRFTGSQRVAHDWATELNWTEWFVVTNKKMTI